MPPSRDPKESRKVRKNRTIKGSRSSTHIRRSSQAMKQTFHSDEQKVKKKIGRICKRRIYPKNPEK